MHPQDKGKLFIVHTCMNVDGIPLPLPRRVTEPTVYRRIESQDVVDEEAVEACEPPRV
jgi:hypothetical protein